MGIGREPASRLMNRDRPHVGDVILAVNLKTGLPVTNTNILVIAYSLEVIVRISR